MIDFDVETNGLQPHSGKQEAFLWIFLDDEDNAEAIQYTPLSGGNPENRERIQAWFDRAKVQGIRAWNAKFDRAFAEQAGFDIPGDGMWYDGMIYAHAINERRSVALKAVAKELFGDAAADDQMKVKNWLKEERARRKKASTEAGTELIEPNYSDVPMEIMEPYGLEDVILTRKIADQYLPIIEQTPDIKRVVDFEHGVLDALYAVEKRGIPASATDYRHLEQECISNLDALEEKIDELASAGGVEEFNPKSSPQIIAALKGREADLTYATVKDGDFEGPWIDLAKKDPHRAKEIRETGKGFSADAESLRNIDDELAATLLEFRSEFKVLSTYVRPMIGRHYDKGMRMWKEPFLSEDGRIHANYRQLGARTGRMSCIAAGSYVDAPRDLVAHPKGIKIEDIKVGQYVYSFDAAGVPRPKKVTNVLEQGTKPVLKLVWRAAGNKSYLGELRATPDHLIRLRDGSYRRMDELKAGDQLAFLSRQVTGDGYSKIVWAYGSGNGVASAVDEHRHLVSGDEVTHHINENKLDNNVHNLQAMSVVDHLKLHNPVGLKRPDRNKPCPFTQEELGEVLSNGILYAIKNFPHDHKTFKRWAEEYGITIPDKRKTGLPTNHVVVAVVDEGETVPTYDLTIEDTPNFIVNEIGVHNCSDPNIQNQPRDDLRLRYCIRAEPGYKLVTCDLSNIEMVLFAAYCGNGKLLEAVQAGEDLHELTAEMLGFRDRERSGGNFESARQQGKTYNFSRIYGGGLRTIQKSFRCDRDHARLLKKRFDEAYPEVKRLTDRIQYRLYDQGYISDKLISGRRFRVEPREAYKGTNYLVQGTAASLLKEAVVKLHQDGVPIVALVHDEVIAHVPEAEAESARDLIIQRMTENKDVLNIVPLSADGDICDHWSDAKPLKDGSLYVPNWVSQ